MAAKRAKEEAVQAIKMEAKSAVRMREKAIYDARIALVRSIMTIYRVPCGIVDTLNTPNLSVRAKETSALSTGVVLGCGMRCRKGASTTPELSLVGRCSC